MHMQGINRYRSVRNMIIASGKQGKMSDSDRSSRWMCRVGEWRDRGLRAGGTHDDGASGVEWFACSLDAVCFAWSAVDNSAEARLHELCRMVHIALAAHATANLTGEHCSAGERCSASTSDASSS